ncbi:UNVERIFIED_CONTAM: NAC domain-containing protein JA2 [Sesamum radiatum]|uniref:NAC domain-containing protein JA2 n=1 Tax=Sesamum radiatum TaxID=300843 RepID=A0AAW2PK62_SESRA
MPIGDGILQELPVGWRFAPTDEELIASYLTNKVFVGSLPARVIEEIDADEFYNKRPQDLGRDFVVSKMCNEGSEFLVSKEHLVEVVQMCKNEEIYWDLMENLSGKRQWYFFINGDEYFHGKTEKDRCVGDGIGYWKSIGKENPIHDAKGNVFAFKILYTYFSANPKHKRTHWRMEEFRLLKRSTTNEEDFHMEEWVVARITRGEDYNESRFY